MTIARTTWVDDNAPDITASQLNRIEAAIQEARQTLMIDPGNIPAGASVNATLLSGPSARLLRVAATAACRVRVYSTAAKRTADASRNIGVDPTGDHGLYLEAVFTAALLSLDLSPQPIASAMDTGAPPDRVWVAIDNTGAAAANPVVTFTLQSLESI